MEVLNMKKRFNMIEKYRAYKRLKEIYNSYQHDEYIYTQLKFIKKKFLFVGNIRNVKTVFLVPYNTKRDYIWFSKFYYPFNFIKELRKNIVARFVPAMLLYTLLVMTLLFSSLFIPYSATAINLILYSIMLIVLPLAFFGIGSKNNVASSDAMLQLMNDVLNSNDAVLKNRIGFIICDTTERITLMQNIKKFFANHNKNPLLIEIPFFSGEGELYVAGTKNESKIVTTFARKNKLHSTILPLLPEYYTYSKLMMLSFGLKDKDMDVYLKYTLKNKEHFDNDQYEKIKSLLLSEIHD